MKKEKRFPKHLFLEKAKEKLENNYHKAISALRNPWDAY